MKTPEMIFESLIEKITRTKAPRSAAAALFTAGMILCAVLLLPPVQNALFKFAGILVGKELSAVKLESILTLPLAGFALCAFFVCALFSKQIAAFLNAREHQKKLSLFLLFAALLTLIFNSVFMYRYGWQWLDSDASSEMVLAKLLANENSLVSRNWHYSTEIRLVYQTIFTMPLFKLLGGGGVKPENWALIRALAVFFNSVVLLLSYLYFIKPFKIKAVYVFTTAIFLIVPFSRVYWHIIIFGGYYAFFLAQLFCALGLFKRLIDGTNGENPRRFIIDFALFSTLTVLLGLQTIRSLLSIYIPLLITGIFISRPCDTTKNKMTLAFGVYGFALCAAGFAMNYLLRFIYSFHTFENMRFENLQAVLFTKTEQCIAAAAGFLGMTQGDSMLSSRGLFSLFSIAATVVLVYYAARRARGDGEKFTPVFFLASALFNIFVFIVTGEKVTGRYFIPFMIFFIPIAALAFNENEKTFSGLKWTMIFSAVILFIFGGAFLNYEALEKSNVNAARKGYIKYLLENHLDYGFATFTNANVTTELSNGKIELAGLEPHGLDEGGNNFRIQYWLNPVHFYNSEYHKGESFLLLTNAEWQKAKETGRAFSQRPPDYEDGHFIILCFPRSEIIYNDVLDR
jgi:hypothetical protein